MSGHKLNPPPIPSHLVRPETTQPTSSRQSRWDVQPGDGQDADIVRPPSHYGGADAYADHTPARERRDSFQRLNEAPFLRKLTGFGSSDVDGRKEGSKRRKRRPRHRAGRRAGRTPRVAMAAQQTPGQVRALASRSPASSRWDVQGYSPGAFQPHTPAFAVEDAYGSAVRMRPHRRICSNSSQDEKSSQGSVNSQDSDFAEAAAILQQSLGDDSISTSKFEGSSREDLIAVIERMQQERAQLHKRVKAFLIETQRLRRELRRIKTSHKRRQIANAEAAAAAAAAAQQQQTYNSAEVRSSKKRKHS